MLGEGDGVGDVGREGYLFYVEPAATAKDLIKRLRIGRNLRGGNQAHERGKEMELEHEALKGI